MYRTSCLRIAQLICVQKEKNDGLKSIDTEAFSGCHINDMKPENSSIL